MWKDAITLREIVEFGDSDATSDEYSSRSEAGRLLLLLFRIGLAIFDQGAAQCPSSSSPQAQSLVDLYQGLVLANREMNEIDSTLNHDKWLSITRHLIVRRMIWEQSAGSESQSGNFQVFKPDNTPSVAKLLAEIKGDVIELASILQSLLLNGVNASRMKTDLDAASINLPEIVLLLRRLNKYHPRKYPIDESQIQKLLDL